METQQHASYLLMERRKEGEIRLVFFFHESCSGGSSAVVTSWHSPKVIQSVFNPTLNNTADLKLRQSTFFFLLMDFYTVDNFDIAAGLRGNCSVLPLG